MELNRRGYDWMQAERQMTERMQPRRTIELDASHASLAAQPTAITALFDQAATSVADQ